MTPRGSNFAAGLLIVACLLAILAVATPGVAAPVRPSSDDTPTTTATPVAVLYLPVIASGFVSLPTATTTATATASPTATPTPTPTLPPPCPLPAERDDRMTITVSPNRATALEQLVGRVPFTVNMAASASGGVEPYSFCWDLEPDGHQDATVANPTFTLTRAGAVQPLIVVFDAQGNGQYAGIPPAGSPAPQGGRP